MKTKNNVILTLILAFMVQLTFAQERTISGIVSDEMGPVADVSVKVKGTNKGTVTDFDGNYAIKAKTGDIIEFTHVSYTTVTETVGTSSKIDVTVKESGESLDEVVITAQGISRDKKTLGYSVTTIKSEEIEGRAETDIARILTGKIAGVQTRPAGGFLGSGTAVIIRSKLSITGDNRPLYIVDGVPISADRYQELDPNNIASTSVLKGLAASTLYGEDGRNGVILITTKSGSSISTEKGFEISVSNTLSVNRVANLPDFQNQYGQGADQQINTTYFGTWGAEFNGQQVPHHLAIPAYADAFPEFQGQTVEYRAIPNNVADFFRDGIGNSTSLGIGKSGDGYNFNLNIGHVDQKGFLPHNSLNRFVVGVGGKVKLNNKFTLNSNMSFSRTKTSAPERNMFDLLMYIPRNLDIHNLPFEDPEDNSNVYYRNTQNNPLWTLKNSRRTSVADGVFIMSNLNYKFNEQYNLSYRFGYDVSNRERERYTNKGGAGDGLGSLTTVSNRKNIMDNALMLNFDYSEVSKDITLSGLIGATTKHEKSNVFGMISSNQTVYGFLEHQNFSEHQFTAFDFLADIVGPDGTTYQKNNIGVFGEVKLGFKDYAYLSLSARNDWSSTVEKKNNSLFYPSASISFIPTAAFEEIKGETLNYLKFRAGIGTSANFPDPYYTRATLNASANSHLDANGNNIIVNSLNTLQPNPNLKPERLQEIELGLETKMFNNKFSLDISVYKRIAKDQILSTSLAASTGFTSKLINAGRIDTDGLEIGYNIDIINNKKFKWNVSGNFTAYETTVIDIPVDNIDIFAGANHAVEGEPLGVFMGTYLLRDDDGNLLINQSNGKIISSSDVGLEDKILGDPNEDWSTALTNSVSYKNFTLSGQIEYKHGGDIWSQTASNLLRRGVTQDTDDREGSFVIPGFFANPTTGVITTDIDGNHIPNNIQIGGNDLYFINIMDVHETRIYDSTTFRVRNVNLTYSIPGKYLDRTPLGSLSFGINADNLFFYTPNMPEHLHLDPEVLSSNVGNGQGVDFQNEPSYKTYSFNIKLTF